MEVFATGYFVCCIQKDSALINRGWLADARGPGAYFEAELLDIDMNNCANDIRC